VVKFLIGLIYLILGGVLILAYQSFSPQAPVTSTDVALAWNQSISRLGILPVYPPAEDFFVGDLWGVVAETEEAPLLGVSVRIGHIDLRSEMTSDVRSPVFPDTVEVKPGESFRRQQNKEIASSDPNPLSLALVAFPGITIIHDVKSSATVGFRLGSLGASGDNEQVEEIRIPVAETYGAPTVTSLSKLDEFCSNVKTKLACTDNAVRRVLAYAASDRVLAAREGSYLTRLQLRLVTRVFATREIQQRRFQKGVYGAELTVKPGTEPGKPPEGAPAPGAAAPAAAIETASGKNVRTDQAEFGIKQVFQRPVVFGYRAVTISLPPSTPSQNPLK
jgi:hypothetical protein